MATRTPRLVLGIAIAALAVAAASAHAQTAATVPASSNVYDHLEAVSALLPLPGLAMGQRPMSRRELRRTIAALNTALGTNSTKLSVADQDWIRRELADIAVALAADSASAHDVGGRAGGGGSATLRSGWRTDFSGTNAPWERTDSNGLGTIDAFSNPFARGQNGWPLARGGTANVAPRLVLSFGQRLAIAAEPVATLAIPRDSSARGDFVLNRAYVRGVWRNVALQIGRDEIAWGQSAVDALWISGNAAPLPSIVLSSDTAFTLPWLLRLAGPVRASIMLADLGADQNPPHAKFAGWLVGIQPSARFELNVSVMAQTGGNGGTPATFGQRVIALFPLIDYIFAQNKEITNRIAGGSLRFRVPELSGLDVYYELALDDFDARRLKSSFVDDGGHLLGARLPLALGDGRLTVRSEWHRTSIRLYEHTRFASGVTYHQRIIGDPLGPHANGLYFAGAWQRTPSGSVGLSLASESRDPSLYTAIVTGSRDRGFQFVRLTNDPAIRHTRAALSLERAVLGRRLKGSVAYDRSWRDGGAVRGAWLARLDVTSALLRLF